MTPDMSVTAMYADYVLPIAHHYERHDFTMEGRTPYLQVLDQAVPPLGESVDDCTAMARLAKAISEKAKAPRARRRSRTASTASPIEHDYTKLHDLHDAGRQDQRARATSSSSCSTTPSGMPKITYEELAQKGFVRVDDSEDTQFGPKSPYTYKMLASTRDKQPYETLTGRQQFYMDHDWFLAEGEQLPVHKDPLANQGTPMRLTMGHARHGIHSMWRDDSLLLHLQRGEPDVYVNADDAKRSAA